MTIEVKEYHEYEVRMVVDGTGFVAVTAETQEDAERQVRGALALMDLTEEYGYLSFDIKEVT